MALASAGGDGGRAHHGRCLDYLRGGGLHLFSHRQKLRILREHAEHGLRPNHADAGLPGFGIDRNAARESHIEGDVGRQHLGRLLGIAHLEHPAALREAEAFAAQSLSQVVHSQDPKTMGHNRMFKIYTGIPKRFKRINNKKRSMGSGIRKTNACNDKRPGTPSVVTTSERPEQDDNRSNQQ